jgi:predicted flavoprotein YhiN
LKNVRITAGDRSAWGEATLTRHGLEGNAIYPVVPAIREGATELHLDLKPESSPERLVERIGNKAAKHFGEATGLNRAQLALVKAFTPKDVFASPQRFAEGIKNLHLPVSGLRPVGEAISTVGGIPVEALHPDFTFKQWPQFSAIGEMVDWDAPTGGFLLQGCFAMGRYAAQRLLALHGIST